ncbi:MAG: hypothetical protein RLZZ436_3802 [Planctomycetota bacterium]
MLTDNTVHLKTKCRMANRPTQEFRLGKVKAAIWPNKKAAGMPSNPCGPKKSPAGFKPATFGLGIPKAFPMRF